MDLPRSRVKYSRPCDACSARKVRCDQVERHKLGALLCTRCARNGIACTNQRLKKKCGPKKKHEPAPAPAPSSAMIPLDQLLPFLQVYQTWYYSVWPAVLLAHLVTNLSQQGMESLNETNALSYGLSCAICAAISKHITFLSPGTEIIKVRTDISSEHYVQEALRARTYAHYNMTPTTESLLTSFFLYVYYVNLPEGINASTLYLREAISIAQLLGLHKRSTYLSKSPSEAHRLRKIFYLLLVTERYMAIEYSVPVVLDATVDQIDIADEEYPSLLCGFAELVKVFAIPDRTFFDNVTDLSGSEMLGLDVLRSFLGGADSAAKADWVVEVQRQLENVFPNNNTADIQKVNVLLLKSWMQSLAWQVAFQGGYIKDNAAYLSLQFPIKIAFDLLASTSTIPAFAFESNGPGVSLKLLEIANGLADVLTCKPEDMAYNALHLIFTLMLKFKVDATLPPHLFRKIETIVLERPMHKTLSASGYITELGEEEEKEPSDLTYTQNLQGELDRFFEAQTPPARSTPSPGTMRLLPIPRDWAQVDMLNVFGRPSQITSPF